MTDAEIIEIFKSIIKLGKEDAPGQLNRIIHGMDSLDAYDLLGYLAGIAFLAHPDFGPQMTIKQALTMIER